MSETVLVNNDHALISVMDEDGTHHPLCSCELTDGDINDDGTVTFPLTNPGCEIRK